MSKSPHTSNDPLMLDCIAGDSAVTRLGPHADFGGPNIVEHNSGLSWDLSSRIVCLLSRCHCGPHRRFTNYSLWTQLSVMNL
jgi:hypothetical protein